MITPLPPDLPPHAFGVDDAATSSPNPVPIGGHFNQALLGHSCRAPKVNDGLLSGRLKEPSLVTISYDEKPGIQAIANTTPDLPAVPGKHPSVTRDYEYVRHGTVSLLAGINLHTGQITEMVSETHKSKDFVEYL